jgi:hypothetical protein
MFPHIKQSYALLLFCPFNTRLSRATNCATVLFGFLDRCPHYRHNSIYICNTISTLRFFSYSEDGNRIFFRNVSKLLSDYKAPYLKK